MTTSVRMLIEEDCILVLERALIRQTLCAFGEDGFGQHGRSDTPHYYDVVDLRVSVDADDDDNPTVVSGSVIICLRGYDADVTGHIITDKNFDISLAAALANAGIPKEALAWAPLGEQTRGAVVFNLDIGVLLGW